MNPGAKERAVERARSLERARPPHSPGRLPENLPALIDNHVGEYMQKLESRLVNEFRELGERTVEESTAALHEQLNERIETLEQVSAIQSETLLHLRDASRAAEQKVSTVVTSIESSLAHAIPGFQLAPPPAEPKRIEPRFEQAGHTEQHVSRSPERDVFCPICTSVDVRRANRAGIFDQLLRLVLLAPFRCRACRHKFYRF